MADEETIEAVEYTPADQWPTDDGGQDLTLPSGAHVRVATPPVMLMAMSGDLPAHLLAIGRHHKADKKGWTAAENLQALEWLIVESFVFPKATLAKKAPKGVISISHMSDRDKEAVAMTLRLQNYAGMLK